MKSGSISIRLGAGAAYLGDGPWTPLNLADVAFYPVVTLVERFVRWDYACHIDANAYAMASGSISFSQDAARIGIAVGLHSNLLVLGGETRTMRRFLEESWDDNEVAEFDGYELGFGPAGAVLGIARLFGSRAQLAVWYTIGIWPPSGVTSRE